MLYGLSTLRSARESGPPQGALAAGYRVDHGGVGLKPHALLQPVEEDTGDQGAFLGDAGLLLDDGGEHHRLIGIVEADRRITPLPQFDDDALHVILHAPDQIGPAVAERIVIGLGQERAFRRHRCDFPHEHRRGAERSHDLGACHALRHGEPVRDGVAGDQLLHHAARRDQRLEHVLAGLERMLIVLEPEPGDEEHRIVDDARLLQPIGDVEGTQPLGQDHGALVACRPWRVELAVDVEPTCDRQDDGETDQDRQPRQRP